VEPSFKTLLATDPISFVLPPATTEPGLAAEPGSAVPCPFAECAASAIEGAWTLAALDDAAAARMFSMSSCARRLAATDACRMLEVISPPMSEEGPRGWTWVATDSMPGEKWWMLAGGGGRVWVGLPKGALNCDPPHSSPASSPSSRSRSRPSSRTIVVSAAPSRSCCRISSFTADSLSVSFSCRWVSFSTRLASSSSFGSPASHRVMPPSVTLGEFPPPFPESFRSLMRWC